MSELPKAFTDFISMPNEIKGAYHLDGCQLPSIRIKYDKTNLFVS